MKKKFVFTERAQFVFKSVLAAVLIALAGGTFLACNELLIGKLTPADQLYPLMSGLAKVIGAFLFSIGLYAVIILNANLYTGKIGYVDNGKKALRALIMLIFNVFIAFLIGVLYRGTHGFIADPKGPFGPESARLLKEWYKIFFDGFGCGVLIYLAVELYKKTKSPLPVIICVMAFILSGTEHSIADAFYLGASKITAKAWGYLGLIILGNTAGSFAIHWLQKGAEYLNELPDNIQR